MHKRLKARAAVAGMTLSDYLVHEIRRETERPSVEELRAKLRSRSPATPSLPPARALRAERDGNDRVAAACREEHDWATIASMPNRAKDWIAQALRDLEQARASMHEDRHEWACFAAQQGAEKAVKGLHLAKGQEAWGHVVANLLRELPFAAPELLIQKAQYLDTLYVATRYVNGHVSGAPFEHYGPLQSQQAIDYASEIFEFARTQMA